MKCPVCGRRMLDRITYLECPNILCDYEEEVEDQEILATPEPKNSFIAFDNSIPGVIRGAL